MARSIRRRVARSAPVRYASEDEVTAALSAMPEEFLDCREGHSWTKGGTHWDDKRGYYVRVRLCLRCGTRKSSRVGPTGSVIGNPIYERPDGYLITGIGRIAGGARDAVRLYNITREMSEAAQEAREKAALAPRRNGSRRR